LVLQDGICFELDDGKKYTFSFGAWSMYRESALNFCVYLWKNPIFCLPLNKPQGTNVNDLRTVPLGTLASNRHVGGSITDLPKLSHKDVPIEGPKLDIEILRKRKGKLKVNHLDNLVLCLGNSKFGLVTCDKKRLYQSNTIWEYANIHSLMIRRKPCRMYIIFENGKGDTQHIISSYLQLITNEVVRRSAKTLIEFEQGVIEHFEYNRPELSCMPFDYKHRDPLPTLPLLVKHTISLIKRKGLQEEGIFRLSGSKNNVQELWTRYATNSKFELSPDVDVNDAAAVFTRDPVVSRRYQRQY